MNFYYIKPGAYDFSKYSNCIILTKDNWDDWFTFETKSYMRYIDSEGTVTEIGSVKIGQTNMSSGQRTAEIPSHFQQLPQNCFSLGQSDYYYASIGQLGDDLRKEILEGLNDIAYDLNLFKRVRNLPVTGTSLMREVSAFTITQQFHRIAMGKARLTNYDIEYTYPIKNDTTPTSLSFHVTPESFPPTNIHVIIGRNNVGKTYFIKNFIRAVYKPDDRESVGMLRSSNSETGRLVRSSRQQAFANILCVSFSPFDDYGEIREMTSKRKVMPFTYIGLTSDNLYETLKNNFVKSLTNCQKSERKLELLEQALNILETDPIFERSNIKSLLEQQSDSTCDNNKNDVENAFKRLSSGHQVIMLTLVQLIDCITERSLVILDEPENHLHPPLLAAFIRALSELLIDRNGVALIATHSPVILQEVPKSCVWKINRNGYEVKAERLEIESFGATIGALTREVFGLEVRQSGFHKMLIDEVKKGLDYNSIIEKFKYELGDEARLLLRTLIILRDEKNETFN